MSANRKYRIELEHWNYHYRPVTFDVEAYMRDTLRKLIPKPDFVVERERLEAKAATRKQLAMQGHSDTERERETSASAMFEGCSKTLEPLTHSSETLEMETQWTTGVGSETLWDDHYAGQLKVILRLPPPDASEPSEETPSWSSAESSTMSSQASSLTSDNPWLQPFNPRFSFFAFDFNPRCKLISIDS